MFVYKKLAHKFVRCLNTSSALRKNHYDVLGITPKATQADVKAAYYRLSMIYHPDKNKDNQEASEKFKEVSSAYEVLGNAKLRRMYDKGLIQLAGPGYSSSHVQETEEHPQAGFYRSREQRARPPPPSGKTPIYDFDEWARSHYGATFARDMEIKRRRKMREKINEDINNQGKVENVLGAVFVMLAFIMYMTADTRQDNIVYKRASDNSIPSKIEKEK